MSRRRQKGKHMKRPKNWHRGRGESRAATRALRQYPTSDPDTPPTGEPTPIRRGPGKRVRGDAL